MYKKTLLCDVLLYRLGRTPEFLLFGHGQQRRTIIEAVRLLEKENYKSHVDDIHDDPNLFKEKAKKWQKFVTQVTTV